VIKMYRLSYRFMIKHVIYGDLVEDWDGEWVKKSLNKADVRVKSDAWNIFLSWYIINNNLFMKLKKVNINAFNLS
jgi:hypothetical protein